MAPSGVESLKMISLVWALGGWATVVVVTVIVLTARACRRAYPDPENSHEGRVLPEGVSVVQAIRATPEDLEELSLDRKGLAPEVVKIREEKPRLAGHDAKELLREMLDTNRYEEQALLGAMITGAAKVDLLVDSISGKLPALEDEKSSFVSLALLDRQQKKLPITPELLVKDAHAIPGMAEYVEKLVRMAARPEEAIEFARRLKERSPVYDPVRYLRGRSSATPQE